MASEIRVNQIQNRSGLSTVTFSDTGVVISGITTITDLRTTGGALIVGTGASIFSPATNQLALGTNNTEDLRIDASGNVGIGTTNPLNKVSVLVNNPTSLSSGAEGLRITDGTRNVQLTRTGSSYSYGGITGTGSLIYSYDTLSLQADTSNPIIFSTGSSEKVRIDSSGNLGIGTAVPSQKLEVVGGEIKAGRVDSTNEGGQVSFGRATDNATGWYIDVYGNTSTPSLRFVDVSNSAVRATIDGSGNFQFNSGYGSAATAYGCRAWVRKNNGFDGFGNGIMGSANVTSLTQQATGRWTVNLTNAMPDTNYAVVATSFRNNSDSFENEDPTVRSTTTFTICLMNYSGSRYDFGFSAAVIR